MLEFLFTIVLLAIDIVLVLLAIWILLKVSILIAIVALILFFAGVPTAGAVALVAILFTIGKWFWVKK